MRFKTYIGTHTDLSRLIGEAQHELGPEAVIKTEYFTEGGFFGIGARKMVRVTAGVEEHPGESPFSIVARAIAATVPLQPTPGVAQAVSDSPWHPTSSTGTNGKSHALMPTATLAAGDVPVVPASDVPAPLRDEELPVANGGITPSDTAPLPELLVATVNPDQAELPFTTVAPPMAVIEATPPVDAGQAAMIQAVLSELQALRGEVEALRHEQIPSTGEPQAALAQFSPQVQSLYRTLIDRELTPTLARHIAGEVESRLDPAAKAAAGPVTEAAISVIVNRCLVPPDAGSPVMQTVPRVLMLIGPTGVGKTTTLAKLAAAFHLVDDKQVALITADTYRIGAIDQLRTFSQIINLPLEVVFDPTEFSKALALNEGVQVVLVDTAGRSPKDELRLTELRRFLEIDHPVETLLVVTATTKAPDLRLILDRFGALGLDGLIVTKLDETVAIGPIIELLWDTQLPVRFLANGQNVPDDLVRADEAGLLHRLAEQLVA